MKRSTRTKLLAAGLSMALLLPYSAPGVYAEEPIAQETPVSMPATNTPASTPVANTPASTPAANAPANTPAVNTPASTPAANTPASTPAANTPASTPVANTPASTPTANTPASTPAGGGETSQTPAGVLAGGGQSQETPSNAPAEGGKSTQTPAGVLAGGGQSQETPSNAPAEGGESTQTPAGTPAEGGETTQTPAGTPAEGSETTQTPDGIPAEDGESTQTPDGTPAEGGDTTQTPDGTPAEGGESLQTPDGTPAEGGETTQTPDGTPAEGGETTQTPAGTPAEGGDTSQTPDGTPAEGGDTTQTPDGTPAEGGESQGEESNPEQAAPSDQSDDEDALQAAINSGVYYYGSKADQKDITDIYIYDDELLKGSSRQYNAALATMSLCLVNSSIASKRSGEDYTTKSQNLKAFLEDNGFSGFETNEDYKKIPTLETMGVACAYKKITDGGRTYTLLVIAPRSAGYKTEWGGNFDVGTDGDHEGFQAACNKVLDFAKKYVQAKGITGDIKVWTAGGSRGAGVINLVGKELLQSPSVLGNGVSLSPENLYCYTFGTPKTADTSGNNDVTGEKYQYIHNLSEGYDIVGIFAPEGLGFGRYGETSGYVDPAQTQKMLQYLGALSVSVYNAYQKGDPDQFTPKKIDLEKLLKGQIVFDDTTETYLGSLDQAGYMNLLQGTLAQVFETRNEYANSYQEPLMRFFGYIYGGSGEFGTLFQGIKSSGYMVPTALTMYISVVMEQYLKSKEEERHQHIEDIKEAFQKLQKFMDEELTDEQKKPFNELFNDLKQIVDEAEQQGKEINDERIEKSWQLTANFYSKAMQSALKNIKTIDESIKTQLTSPGDSKAMTKLLGHLLLLDSRQNKKFGFNNLGQQFVHLATTLGNAKSFMIPHYNEVILSWLRTKDANYADYQKANSAQASGYRRVFVENVPGVDVTGVVKDSKGNVVAVFKNGELVSTTSLWIAMTTSDRGNWLRLPLDDTYRIEFSVSKDTVLNVKVTEYSVEKGGEVREETSDQNYSWKNLAIRAVDSAALIISAVKEAGGTYPLKSDAAYYFDLMRRFFVTFVLDGGTLNNTADIVSMLYDSGTGITLPTPYREGYRFAYWEGSRYNAGDFFTVLGDHVFRAVWEKIEEKTNPSGKKQKKKNQSGRSADGTGQGGSAQLLSVQQPTAVNTADSTPVMFWMIMMMAAFSATVCLAFFRRRRSA